MLQLRETLTFDQAGIVVETKDENNGKSPYMKGIRIQGGVKNAHRECIVNETKWSHVQRSNQRRVISAPRSRSS